MSVLARRALFPRGGGISSLDAQLDAASAEVARRGWTVVGVFSDEGVGGKTAPIDRPGLGAAITQLCDQAADVLGASKLDRLSRDADHLPALMRLAEHCGFDILALDMDVDTTTAMGCATNLWRREQVRARRT